MKKLSVFLLLALLVFGIVGCAGEATTYERTVNGETYIINRENDTVTHEGNTYRYMILGIGTDISYSCTLTIIYPDGSWYRRDVDSNGHVVLGSEQTSDDYDANTYARGEDLCYVLEEATNRAANSKGKGRSQEKMIAKVLVGLMVISLGVINLIFPGLGHQIKYSLWVKDAEPTEFAVVMSRIGGVLLIIMGIVFMFK